MARVKRGKKGGRPKWEPSPADIEEIGKLSRIQCTQEEIAAWFGVGLATFKRRIAESDDLREIIDQGHLVGKISYRRLLWRHAEAGVPKAIGLLGARFGFDEKHTHRHEAADGVDALELLIERVETIVDRTDGDDPQSIH